MSLRWLPWVSKIRHAQPPAPSGSPFEQAAALVASALAQPPSQPAAPPGSTLAHPPAVVGSALAQSLAPLGSAMVQPPPPPPGQAGGNIAGISDMEPQPLPRGQATLQDSDAAGADPAFLGANADLNRPESINLDSGLRERHISASAVPEEKHARTLYGGAEKLLLPAFSNLANKELAAAIQQLEKEVDSTERELDRNVQRTSQMSKYLRSLQLELASTESRLEAKTKELHTEQHLQKLNHHEQRELRQWMKASEEKEEVHKALGMSQHKESAKIKELLHQLERWSKAAASEKAALDQELAQAKSVHIELETTADAFRRLQKERQDTVAQWEHTLAAVSRHDNAIKTAADQFAEQKVDNQLISLERELLRMRRALKSDEQMLESTLDDMEHLKNSLSSSADDLAVQRAANEHARGLLSSKQENLLALQARASQANEELHDNTLHLNSVEQNIKQMETLLLEEQKSYAAAVKLVSSLKEENMRRAQSLSDACAKERLLRSRISGAKAQATNLRQKKRTLSEQAMRQREVLYQADFRLVMLKRSLARAGGQRTDNEAAALHAFIAELSATLDGRNAERNLFLAQIKKTEQDLGNARRSAAELNSQCRRLADSMLHLELETECTSRSLKQTTKEKEDRLVEKDLLAVEVNRCRSALAAKVDEVLVLEHERAQLQKEFEEKRSAVAAQKDVLQAELKMLREDVHQAMLELTERTQRASKLQAKYETLCSKSVGVEGADEARSQAYYMIKAASDKQELLQQKQDLLTAIRGGEEDVAGLESALADMTGSNGELAQSFREKDERMMAHEARQKQLRKQLNRTCADIRRANAQEKEYATKVEAANLHNNNLSAEEERLQLAVGDLKKRKEAAALGAEHEEANIVTSLAVAGIPMPSKSNEGSMRSSRASSLFGSSGPASLKSEASARSGRLQSQAAPMQVLHLNI
ncbi:Coiled-coil domain-containing protein 39 [Coccomyxa sp. Obi]|nr:Coiled-coil domain-containing protein 39 [Coccomyxa sp. Obi]